MSIDWTEAVDLFHTGDWNARELEDYLADPDLPEDAVTAVRDVLELDAALRRAALREKIGAIIRAPRTRNVLPIELSAASRKAQHDLVGSLERLAADARKPLPELQAVCEASASFPNRPLQVQRRLSPGWNFEIALNPFDNVSLVLCGDEVMAQDHAIFRIALSDDESRSVGAILELASRHVKIEFCDGTSLSLSFF